VITLSAHDDDAYVEHLTLLGAAGYFLKQTSAGERRRAIREAQKSRALFNPVVAKGLK
jgi:DNA-binding NarL/FixJ family response regulator